MPRLSRQQRSYSGSWRIDSECLFWYSSPALIGLLSGYKVIQHSNNCDYIPNLSTRQPFVILGSVISVIQWFGSAWCTQLWHFFLAQVRLLPITPDYASQIHYVCIRIGRATRLSEWYTLPNCLCISKSMVPEKKKLCYRHRYRW